MSVTPQAVPARYPPAFRLSLVRSCHGGTSPESHSCLQPTMKLSRITVLGQCPSPIEFGRGHFARILSELFVNFAIERPLADFSPTTNRNPQGQFHIQFFWNFRIFTFFKKKNGKVEQSKPYRQNLSYVIFVIFLALWSPTPVLRYPAASRPLLPVSKPRKTAAGQGIYIQWVHTLRTILCRGRYAREDTSALCAL